MIIKSIKLENIRSYINQEINFPSGSVLLSGDIGAGKSSILLAIEFALFGIMKGDLMGESLLRHGAKEGSVELKFEIDGNEYLIKRYLKRNKEGISQDAGFIMHNNFKKEGTAIELKAKVLDLIGYPKDLLTKSKSLIYRYTVYTPQEEMKRILTEENEQRLNTLRKVFGIDKYKKIEENASLLIKYLRERKKEFEGKIYDLPEKQKIKEDYKKLIDETKIKIDETKIKLNEVRKQKELRNEELAKIENDIKKLNKLQRDLSALESELKEKLLQSKRNEEKIVSIEKEISLLKQKINFEEIEKIKESVNNESEIKNKIKEIEEQISKINSIIKEAEINKTNSEKIKEKISCLNKCPTCLQIVSEDHKNKINLIEDEKIKLNNISISENIEKKNKLELELNNLKNSLETIIQNKNVLIKMQADISNLDEKNKFVLDLKSENEETIKRINELNTAKENILKEVEKLKNIESIYLEIKKTRDEILAKEKDTEIALARYENEFNNFSKIISTLDEEIKNKLSFKEKIQKIYQIELWLDEYFINLMNVMEKNVMGKLYKEFNEFFQRWFNILIGDYLLNVRLDEQFTPIIEQNGFETTFENLSGGEKTSVALAYRLALNKVINDLVPNIKTKDLIILDEPTDGFSSEQLDKVRDILEQLNTKQTIIVSHEPKIESYVDKIIRINKQDHISKIID